MIAPNATNGERGAGRTDGGSVAGADWAIQTVCPAKPVRDVPRSGYRLANVSQALGRPV